MNLRNEDGTRNVLYYNNVISDYYNGIKAHEQENTKIKHYEVDNISVILLIITRQIFRNIDYAKKERASSDSACLFGHHSLKPKFQFLKSVVNDIRYIGLTNPLDMIEISNFYLHFYKSYYYAMDNFQINLKISPLEPYLKDIISELKELCSVEQTTKAKLIKDLKADNLKSQLVINNKHDEIEKFDFTNNFDKVNKDKVYNYFYSELVEKNYLSKDNLQSFIKFAFDKQVKPKPKFCFERKYLIKNIRNIFYRYFDEINTEKYGVQNEYIKLLTDNFEGFEFEKIKKNFNK